MIFAVILVALWCGYWFASQQIAKAAAQRLAESVGAGGRLISCSEAGTGGFPLQLNLACSDATFSDAQAGTRLVLSNVSARAPLYWPGSVSAEIAGPFAIDYPMAGIALDADWTDAVARIEAGFSGLTEAAFSFEDLAVIARADGSTQPFSKLTAGSGKFVAEPKAEDAYHLYLNADAISLTTPDGRDLPILGAEIDVTALDFGSALGTDPGLAVRRWVANGGAMNLDKAAVILGDTTIEASGALSVGADGLVSGDLKVRFSELDALPAAVEEIQPGSSETIGPVLGAVTMMSAPVENDPNTRQMPVSIRNGTAMIGIVPIGTIPPLRF